MPTGSSKGKHHTVAVSHVAHQLLHIAYSVLLHGKPYALPARFIAPQPPTSPKQGLDLP